MSSSVTTVFTHNSKYFKINRNIFKGLLRGWWLGTGPGAYTTTPEDLIDDWPYEKIADPDKLMSALLANQGVNSARLLRKG